MSEIYLNVDLFILFTKLSLLFGLTKHLELNHSRTSKSRAINKRISKGKKELRVNNPGNSWEKSDNTALTMNLRASHKSP